MNDGVLSPTERFLNDAKAFLVFGLMVGGAALAAYWLWTFKPDADGWSFVRRSELDELRKKAAAAPESPNRAIGRYQRFADGGRTWRFDTATGETCLLLAPEVDWSKPDVSKQGCVVVLDDNGNPIKR